MELTKKENILLKSKINIFNFLRIEFKISKLNPFR